MIGSSLTDLVNRLPRLLGTEALGHLTDQELVERIATHRDEAAFALLVERHGPLVLGVSRNVLNDLHAAEDVFQAAFLMLARKAGTLRTGQAVRAWLYQTAVNLSRTLRTATARRQNHERRVAREAMSDPFSTINLGDFQAALHEEVSRLPEKFRLPLLLCHLDGKTHDEAADALGCPVGTVRSRLSRARDLLRRRLDRRGVTVAALALGTLSGTSANAVSFPLVDDTVRSAVAFAEGPTSATEGVSAKALSLAEGALRRGTARLKLLATTVLVFVLASAGVVLAQNPWEEDKPPAGELAKVPAASVVPTENQTLGEGPSKQISMKDEEIEVTPVLNGRYIPPPEYINVSQPLVRWGLHTKWTVEEGRLCAYLQLFVGVQSNRMGDEIHKKQRYTVYQPSAGFAVVGISGSELSWRSNEGSFNGISLTDVILDPAPGRPLCELLTESIAKPMNAVPPDFRQHPEFQHLRRYRTVFVTGDPNATDEEKRLGVHITFLPIRIIVRGPAASLSE